MSTRRLVVLACACVLVRNVPAHAQVDSLLDPSRSRIALGATGRTIPQGHGTLVAHYLLLPTLALGIHDRVTLVAGTAVPFLIGSPGDLPYWVGGKVGVVQRPGMYAAVGALHFRVESDDPGSTLGYAVITGDLDRFSLTVAGLRGFAGEPDAEWGVMVGVELRVDREWTAVAEGWSIPLWGVDPPAVFGLRWSNSRAAFTAGFASWRAPYVDFAVSW